MWKSASLHIDQRAAGESEGKYIGFGVLESRDCCLWAQYIAKRFGPDQKIILAGLSMGASTVLMATAHHEKEADSNQYFHRKKRWKCVWNFLKM